METGVLQGVGFVLKTALFINTHSTLKSTLVYHV
jgi:hypothetical protein